MIEVVRLLLIVNVPCCCCCVGCCGCAIVVGIVVVVIGRCVVILEVMTLGPVFGIVTGVPVFVNLKVDGSALELFVDIVTGIEPGFPVVIIRTGEGFT